MSRPLHLVLASGSPRRIELLRGLGLDPEVRPARIDETPREGEPAEDYVRRLAREKSRADARPGELVLAADTTVLLDAELLGKPADEADAARMLGRIAGREHRVLTGVALFAPDQGRLVDEVVVTRVRMAAMSDEEISWYVASGEPDDKAGAYAIQGLGTLFVEAIEGNYSNVVGLPLPAVYRLFDELALDLRSLLGASARA